MPEPRGALTRVLVCFATAKDAAPLACFVTQDQEDRRRQEIRGLLADRLDPLTAANEDGMRDLARRLAAALRGGSAAHPLSTSGDRLPEADCEFRIWPAEAARALAIGLTITNLRTGQMEFDGPLAGFGSAT